jgi:hypothetical protein
MTRHEASGSLNQAPMALVRAKFVRALRFGVAHLSVAVLMVTAGVSVASASGAQPVASDEPLIVVESFLAARDARDVFGATGWTAALLELQDQDGQWFVDEPTTRYWLGQLTDTYLVETLGPLLVNGNTVTWTERLTRRTVRPSDPSSRMMTIEVNAVIRNGTIGYLSAPYPPLPLRPPPVAPVGQSSGTSAASETATVAPAMMFLGSAAGLIVAAFALVQGVPAVCAALQHRLPPSSSGK